MPALREALDEAGFDDVRTYVQSGNIALSSTLAPAKLAAKCRRLIADGFGLDVDVLVRTRAQLAAVVKRNPLGDVAVNPKRYQVTFLAAKIAPEVVRKLEAAAVGKEQLFVVGREVYAWTPDGIARSKLWALLAGSSLGVTATARNWTTVTSLLALADDA